LTAAAGMGVGGVCDMRVETAGKEVYNKIIIIKINEI
jgi:hypothetical protein